MDYKMPRFMLIDADEDRILCAVNTPQELATYFETIKLESFSHKIADSCRILEAQRKTIERAIKLSEFNEHDELTAELNQIITDQIKE